MAQANSWMQSAQVFSGFDLRLAILRLLNCLIFDAIYPLHLVINVRSHIVSLVVA